MHNKFLMLAVALVAAALALSLSPLAALCEDTAAPSAEPPRRGQKGEAVDALQHSLRLLGLYYVPPEEDYGNQTTLAVERYQALLNELRPLDGVAILLFPDPVKVDGRITRAQHDYLRSPILRAFVRDLAVGADDASVMRLEIRLVNLGYDPGRTNTAFDEDTRQALMAFQRQNGLVETGIADEITQQLLFSADAKPADAPTHIYQLFISNTDQRVYVMEWSEGSYSQPIHEFVCSTGLPNTPTPDGVFQTDGPVSRWCYFPVYECWARYAYRIEGAVLFHSVLYASADESTLRKSSVQSLGRKSSHGCVRMSVEDAKWIFDNCLPGTTVITY